MRAWRATTAAIALPLLFVAFASVCSGQTTTEEEAELDRSPTAASVRETAVTEQPNTTERARTAAANEQNPAASGGADREPVSDGIRDPYNLTEWLLRPKDLADVLGNFLTSDEDIFDVTDKVLAETKNKNAQNSVSVGAQTTFMGRYYFRQIPMWYKSPANPFVQFALNVTEGELSRSRSIGAQNYINETTAKLRNESANGTVDVDSIRFDALSSDEQAQRTLAYFEPLRVVVPLLHAFTMSQATPPDVGERCFADLKHFLHNLYEAKSWALEMFDSWGKIPPGVLNGNINWIGSYDQCMAVDVPGGDKSMVSETAAGFKGSYCDINIEIPESLGLPKAPGSEISLLYGMCFPSTCTSGDARRVMASLSVLGAKLPPIVRSRCHREAPLQSGRLSSDGLGIAALLLAVIFAALVVGCTLVHGLLMSCSEGDHCGASESAASNNKVNDAFVPEGSEAQAEASFITSLKEKDAEAREYDNQPQSNGGPQPAAIEAKVAVPEASTESSGGLTHEEDDGALSKLLKAFSLYTNLPPLMSTETRGGTLLGLDAVRYLSMCWIILGHCYSMGAAFVPYSVANIRGATAILKDFAFQAIFSGPLAVDSFFCLSGTLVAYVFFKQLSKKSLTPLTMLLFYVHRLIRILPLYAFMILMMAALGPYWGQGPLFDWESNYIRGCTKNWWTNLLFVNNFVDSREMCLSWSWYLSNDMQFYWISPVILIPLFYLPVLGIIMWLAFLIAHLILTYWLWSFSNGENYLNNADVYYNAYIKPYCRMGPYLIGIALGTVLFKKYKLPKGTWPPLVGWLTAIGLVGTVVYVQYEENKYGMLDNVWNQIERCLFETFARSAFAIGLAWVIYAVNNGYAGAAGRIMRWGGWQPLGRLTYAAFLVHPMLLFVYVGNRRDLFYVSNFSITWIFCGYMVIAYAASAVLALAVEMPFAALEKLLHIHGDDKKIEKTSSKAE